MIALATVLVAAMPNGRANAAELVIRAATIPPLPTRATSLAGFMPPGWVVKARADGDLNGDGRPDHAFVLHQTDPRHVLDNRGNLGSERLDTNPRVLAVAFAQPDGGLALALQNATLIPRHDSPTMDDPFAGITVRRGALQVALHFWASAGSWETSEVRFTFRLQQGCFRLIGYDRSSTHRGSGETTETSANLSTRRVETRSGNIASDKPVRLRPGVLAPGTPPCIDEVGDGASFEVEALGRSRR
ncbi:hypothetical protein [Piscinibacter koreensis]|uniref:Uncharacterized protein n=1 Tax=Piscinibacter koreensis TaxID=2742824 RepID=A0A7Y6NJE8_9BURK|nr:hypothetical protein [Schlegelella koreensis]NUZ04199.1 hypothetical protein [Schlegelella koreensis]